MDKLIKKVEMDCPFCNKNHTIEKRKRTTESIIKKERVTYQEEYYLCTETNEEENEFVNAKLMDENLLKARDVYRKNKGLLTSKDIKDIRKKYNLTQAEFSHLLGLGEITITRYESKLIQDETYDKIIRLIGGNALLALDCLKENKDKFKSHRFNEIEENIKTIIKEDTYNYLNVQEIYTKYVQYEKESILNGFTKINISKLNSVLKYISEKMDNLFKVKLMKILWYIDFIYYKTYNKSITGLVYLHERMGALPIGFDEIIKLPSIKVDEQIKEYDGEYKSCYHILPNKNYKTHKLSENETNIIDKIIEKFYSFDTNEIVYYMHKEKAYTDTIQNQIIDYSFAKYINI